MLSALMDIEVMRYTLKIVIRWKNYSAKHFLGENMPRNERSNITEDRILTMEVEINSADEERLKTELLEWWNSNASGMGEISFKTRKTNRNQWK